MTILSPSTLETSNYGTAGWNAINSSNLQKINAIWDNIQSEIKWAATQEEITYTDIADVKNKVIFGPYIPKVSFAAGTYTTLDLDNIFTDVELIGDERPHAGLTYMHCASATTIVPHWSTILNAGVGVVTLSSTGDDITIACGTTNPDFSDWVAGDKLIICNTSKNVAVYEIKSVSTNTITLTTAAPTINGYGASVTFVPNRIIDIDLYLDPQYGRVKFAGFKFESNYAAQTGLIIDGKCGFKHCVITSTSADTVGAFYNADVLFEGHENTIIGGAGAAYVANGGKHVGPMTLIYGGYFSGLFMGNGVFDIDYSRIISGNAIGLHAEIGAQINAQYSTATKCTKGFSADYGSTIYARSSYASYCSSYGYSATNSSAIQCFSRAVHNNTSNQNGTVVYS